MLFRSDLRAQIKDRQASAGAVTTALAAFDKRAEALEGRPAAGFGGGGRGGAAEGPETLSGISGSLNQLMTMLQGADVTPTTQLVTAVGERKAALAKLMTQWNQVKGPDLASVNAKLKEANQAPISLTGSRPSSQP